MFGALAGAFTGLGASCAQRSGDAAPARVLMVTTSWGVTDAGEPTGLWLSEFTDPYFVFKDAGALVRVASVAGGYPPIDPRSRAEDRGRTSGVARFEDDDAAKEALRAAPALETVDVRSFDAIFLCGGHGTMWDFVDGAVPDAVSTVAARGGVVGAVCHGPAGLVNATRAGGAPLVAGRRVTGFTNAEEEAVGLTNAVPFLLEDALLAQGATFAAAADFQRHVVRDERLVTGQNPASANGVAFAVLDEVQAAASV